MSRVIGHPRSTATDAMPHGHAECNVNIPADKENIDVMTGMVRSSGVPVSASPA
ncbi:hypothetical protein [Nocardia sp. NPDC005366]|uniref:hypothetical protein n=1 Tax=Nocardia sp. NPDC005366 TaxID=3156878 RepID=UPI00339E8BDA